MIQLREEKDFTEGSHSKESACNAGDSGSIPSQEDSPEKEMATHCSILAWEILWTEEPSKLQSTGSQRLRHELMTQQQQHMLLLWFLEHHSAYK